RWGLGGQDSSGAQLRLGGASFAETNFQFQLAGVTLFWIIRNSNGMRANYVQGLSHPKSVHLYALGVAQPLHIVRPHTVAVADDPKQGDPGELELEVRLREARAPEAQLRAARVLAAEAPA